MKYYKIYFLVVGFIFFTDNLYAKDYEYNGRCSANMTFFESCLDKEFNMYDKELNRIYKYFIKASPHENLKKAEALWVRFKEADCNYVAGEVNGGLEYQFIYKACLINKTKARIADLKRSFFYSGWFKKQS